MQLRYDADADALYITLRQDEPVSRTVEMDSGTLVDVDRLGRALGIEVLAPAREWPLEMILEQHDVTLEDAAALRSVFETSAWDRRFPFAAAAAG